MNHRKWTNDYPARQQARKEHELLYNDWKHASLEAKRLAKANGDACDRIAELESSPVLTWEECEAKWKEFFNRNNTEVWDDSRDFRDWLKSRLPAPVAARPQPVPVRVRFEYDPAERIAAHDAGVVASDMFLHAHAVIDVPAGVPSVVELVKMVAAAHYGWDLGSVIYLGSTDVAKFTPYATAIRDAVLAGAAASQKPSSTIAAMLAAQEATRKHNSGPYGAKCPKCFDTGTIMMVGGPSQRCDCKFLKMAAPSVNIEELPESPKGLPSAEELEAVFDAGRDDGMLVNMSGIEAILAALAPYLREPTGWELDVTADELCDVYCETYPGKERDDWKAVLDLCRSRIRPTFECKECAEKDNKIHSIRQHYFDVQSKLNAARAALEGE